MKYRPNFLAPLWKEFLKPALVFLAITAPLRSVVADYNWVPTGSMKPTILEGDVVWVNKLAYDLKVPFTLQRLGQWADPNRGEIVVFFSPENGLRLVKRIVAGPGDTVAMQNNVLSINGKALQYDIALENPFKEEIHEDSAPVLAHEKAPEGEHWVLALPNRPAQRSFPTFTLPQGQYFMLGDSRDNSHDSRFFGPVDRQQIVGKATNVLLSINKNRYGRPRLNRTGVPL